MIRNNIINIIIRYLTLYWTMMQYYWYIIHYKCVKYECYIPIIFSLKFIISHENSCMFYWYYCITIVIISRTLRNESILFCFAYFEGLNYKPKLAKWIYVIFAFVNIYISRQNWQKETSAFHFCLWILRFPFCVNKLLAE